MSKTFLTDDIVRALRPEPGKAGNTILWDADAEGVPDSGVTGFGALVTPAGKRSLIFNYRTHSGRQGRETIAKWPAVRIEPGRKKARELRAAVLLGADPQAEKAAKRAALTINALAERMLDERSGELKATTRETYARLLKLYIGPSIGRARVSDVTDAMAHALKVRVEREAGPYQANRVLALCSMLFTFADAIGIKFERNPFRASKVKRFREHARKRYLSIDEITRLRAALAAHKDSQSVQALTLLLYTGARRGEVLSMKWSDLDLKSAQWKRRAVDLKGGKDHWLPLAPPVVRLLEAIKATHAGARGSAGLPTFVFPAPSKSKHLTDVKRVWRQVIKAADLPGVRIHDLRHSFASVLASSGKSLVVIGGALGHASQKTTARYAHLLSKTLADAIEEAGAIIEAAGPPLAPPPSPTLPPNAVPFRRRSPR
jgi:integrase